MPGVYSYNPHSRFLGFVAEKRAQLSKRPAMQPALGFASSESRSASNLGKIFNHDSCARSGALDNSFGENVVAIPVKPYQSASQLSQMLFGRLRAFGLQLTFEAKIAAVNFLPVAANKKLSFGSNRRVIKSEVYTDG